MKYGINTLSIIPLRKEAREQSEMISQILFGETYTIIEIKEKWIKIKNSFDNYTGWIDKKMHHPIHSDCFHKKNNNTFITNNICKLNKTNIIIPAGSYLPNYDIKNRSFNIDSELYFIDKNAQKITSKHKEDIIISSKCFLGSPYLWGGRTHLGIDCSGFSQIVYKINGINIPRDAKDQINIGIDIVDVESSTIGDLAFFENEDGKIIHVGIICENNTIIHASGKVRIDSIDDKGIYTSIGNYTHKLNIIKRII